MLWPPLVSVTSFSGKFLLAPVPPANQPGAPECRLPGAGQVTADRGRSPLSSHPSSITLSLSGAGTRPCKPDWPRRRLAARSLARWRQPSTFPSRLWMGARFSRGNSLTRKLRKDGQTRFVLVFSGNFFHRTPSYVFIQRWAKNTFLPRNCS